MNFDSVEIAPIERALELQRPGGWSRLSAAPLREYSGLNPSAAWKLEMPTASFPELDISFLIVVIDSSFPWSQPRVVAPEAPSDGTWPHVESGGLLCLPELSLDAKPADRVIATLEGACAVLSLDPGARHSALALEASTYWNNSIRAGLAGPRISCLLDANGPTREIWYSPIKKSGPVLVGDDPDQIRSWLLASGYGIEGIELKRTVLVWLSEPLVPSEFPQTHLDLFRLPGIPGLSAYLDTEGRAPVVLGANSEIGPVLVGVTLNPARPKDLPGGFRDISKIPWPMVLGSAYARQHLRRCRVERVDPSWVHGRDKNPASAVLAGKAVAIIGCGSLGGSIAKLLAQAGVGNFFLIDPDVLSPQNTSRHVLGAAQVGKYKAEALKEQLSLDFPHLESVESVAKRFELLEDEQLSALATCDVVLSAGLDISADFSIDEWRFSLEEAPVHVCTWVEALALAGHAVALAGKERLLSGFEPDGAPRFRLVDWGGVRTQFREAGCGSLFQPHSAADLQFTVAMASSLVLRVLTSESTTSCREAWHGDRELVRALGGVPRPDFSTSRSYVAHTWP